MRRARVVERARASLARASRSTAPAVARVARGASPRAAPAPRERERSSTARRDDSSSDARDAYSASLRARAEAAKRVGRTRGEASSERVAMTMGADGTAPRFYEARRRRANRDARDGTWRVDARRAARCARREAKRVRVRDGGASRAAIASGVGRAGRARRAVYDAADVAERDGDRSHGRRGDATGARGDAAETLWHGRVAGCGARTRRRRRGRARAHDPTSWRGRRARVRAGGDVGFDLRAGRRARRRWRRCGGGCTRCARGS